MSEKIPPLQALQSLRAGVQSAMLATLGENGDPHIGYTPFVFDDRDIVVFVSQLSLHTRDLLATPRVSVMLIDDEQSSSQIFARTRVSYLCQAKVVDREDQTYAATLDLLESRHGKMIGVLRQLPDFVLFRLQPQSGQFVMGFGQAYRLAGENLDEFEHATSA